MILFIDTTDPERISLALVEGDKVYEKAWRIKQQVSETLFEKLSALLKSRKANFAQLKKIVAVLGPGPFSRVRTGVVVANALAYALNIPTAGVKVSQIPKDLSKLGQLKFKKQNLKPFYSRPANITKPKKRNK